MGVRDWKAQLDRLVVESPAVDEDTLFEGVEDDPAEQQALETELLNPALQHTRDSLARVQQAGCEQYMQAVHAGVANRSRTRPDPSLQKRIFKMFRHKAIQIAAAAAVILIATNWWFSWGDRANPNAAFAAAIARLRGADTIVCRFTTSHTGAMPIPATTGKLYLSAEHGGRYDFSVGGAVAITHYMPLEGPAYTVTPSTTTYMRIQPPEQASDNPSESSPQAWLTQLREFSADADRSLGYETIDDHTVKRFEVSGAKLGWGDDVVAQLWIDTDTLLPVRYEIQLPNPAEAGSTLTVTHDQFEWDLQLDPALFEVDIPEDYTRIDLAVPPISEQTLLDGLATFAALSGNAYPAALTFAEMMASLGELSAAYAQEHGFDKGDVQDAQTQELMQKAIEVGAAMQFYQQLQQQGRDPQYFGDEVKPGEAEQVLMSWKLDDGQQRVIYGDLSVETVPQSD